MTGKPDKKRKTNNEQTNKRTKEKHFQLCSAPQLSLTCLWELRLYDNHENGNRWEESFFIVFRCKFPDCSIFQCSAFLWYIFSVNHPPNVTSLTDYYVVYGERLELPIEVSYPEEMPVIKLSLFERPFKWRYFSFFDLSQCCNHLWRHQFLICIIQKLE